MELPETDQVRSFSIFFIFIFCYFLLGPDQVRSFSHVPSPFSLLQTSHLPPYCSLMPLWDVLDVKWNCYENLLVQNQEPKNPSPR